MRRIRFLGRGFQAIVLTAVVLLLAGGLAFADNVVNDVVVGGNDTITAGGSTTINYKVNTAAAGDSQSGCNASDGTPVTINLSVPAAVSASDTSFTITNCVPTSKAVSFSSNTAGDYAINVSSISDSGTGTYNNQANWTLHVNGVTPPADTTAPSINCGSADNQWHGSNVSIACTASDSGSGLANPADASFNLVTSLANGNENANVSTNSRQVCDNAGNCATAGPISGNMIDLKDPSVSITCPSGAVVIGSNQSASWSASDGGSGVSGPDSGQVTLNTSSVGSHTANSPNVSDNVNNGPASDSCTYSVVYNFSGFFQPIDNNIANSAKAGQSIPVKWRLTDANGVGISDPASFVNVVSNTGSGACSGTPDAVEEYAGSSGLQYLGDGYWQFNWKTPKSYAGQCRTMELKLANGTAGGQTYKTASFTFK